ncbi:MAG: mechanosensitive ion channel [Flavobacteriales bacterium]|nr:mechanosensitive ion channel [Flavobacteriales bacterium]
MEKIKLLFQDPLAQRLIFIGVGIFIILIVAQIIKKGLNKTVKNNDNKYKARKAVGLISYIFMIALILFVYSDKLGNIGVALGVAGAGIAFALQEIIITLAGWLNIVVGGTVSVGQRVKIGEIKGDIIDISVMRTTIMEVGDWVNGDLYNGSIVSLGNSFVFKEKVHNYSAEYPFLWDELTVPIRTESDYKKAKEVFTNVLNEICGDYALKSQSQWQELSNKYKVEDAQVKPMVTLKFDESWITFTLRYIVDYKKRRGTKDLIYTRLLDEIAKYDDIIMIASATLEVTNIKAENQE